ncbi:hypothetical protein L596_014121 [Steinernema carpocapsae]|uniref:Beta-hexosaminidase n=1 Tax=Steinernema carpocapsae TaxID=34508 RepID=A0A4U5NC39_STECR|nr:hypothetical protein L596_014121 [Steinernema carpocapsae]
MLRLVVFATLLVALEAGDWFYGRPRPDAWTQGGVWPLPQKISYGENNRSIDPKNFDIVFDDNTGCDYLVHAKQTYKKWMFPFKNSADHSGADEFILEVKLKTACPRTQKVPPSDMNEHYTLSIKETGHAFLEADEIWGALRGLESFSHLIWFCNKCHKYRIRTVEIDDKPRFPVRGYMIDTSRHFLSVNTIKRQIDLMAQNKLNVLHWHIVDSESFPYESRTFPDLHKKGAYSTRHFYSQKQVTNVINHARLRGVRVMAEFDTPGHMGSWQGQPGILADCFDEHQKKTDLPNLIDPTKQENFEFLEKFFKEILEVFQDDYLHLGGDEVSFWIEECWSRNPVVKAFMEKKGINGTVELENYYFQNLEGLLHKVLPKNKRILYWQEVFDQNKPPKDAIVHVWKGNTLAEQMTEMTHVTAAGHQAILSSCWYLNYIHYGPDWKEGDGKFYYCDPRGFNGTEEQKNLVLGGIVAMWGEFVDATNIEARTWPRASSVAERLWSDPEQTKDAEVAWPRLHEFRCRMLARGFRAEPNNAPDFCPQEWEDEYPPHV